MDRRTFIKNAASFCVSAYLGQNTTLFANTDANIIKTPLDGNKQINCAIGIGDFGDWAVDMLSNNNLDIASFRFNGTIDADLALATKRAVYSFILSDLSDQNDLYNIDQLRNFNCNNGTFTLIISPKYSVIKEIPFQMNPFETVITPPYNLRKDCLHKSLLAGIAGLSIPLSFTNRDPLNDCIDLVSMWRIAGGKIGTFYFGYSNNLITALEEAIKPDWDMGIDTVRSVLICIFSPIKIEMEIIDNFIVDYYAQKLPANVHVMCTLNKTTYFNRPYTAFAYWFREL